MHKKLSIMKFYFCYREVELLKKLEASVLDICPFDETTREITLTGTQVRDFVLDLFDWIPLLTDKDEQWTLSNLGWRLTNKCL